jgi:FkbM family methyltransferase
MGKFRRGVEICRRDGIRTLAGKAVDYARHRYDTSQQSLWSRYYDLKAVVFGTYVVSVDGVLIDLDAPVFSPAMVKQLRTKKYETAERTLIQQSLRADCPTIDLGAGVGYTTCLIDKQTDSRTVGVEANESLISVLERTRTLNDCAFEIAHFAYDSTADFIEFQIAEDFWSSSSHERRSKTQTGVTVPAASITELVDKHNLERPIQLVVDIEGGEHDLFVDEQDTLRDSVSVLIFEYHTFTEKSQDEYNRILKANGFECVRSRENVYVYLNNTFN